MRFCTPEMEPQGAVLSASADQTLSGGHIKAAGPMLADVEGAPAALAPEAISAQAAARVARRAISAKLFQGVAKYAKGLPRARRGTKRMVGTRQRNTQFCKSWLSAGVMAHYNGRVFPPHLTRASITPADNSFSFSSSGLFLASFQAQKGWTKPELVTWPVRLRHFADAGHPPTY